MLRKIEAKGPIRWRDLRRSFASSRDAVLAPVRDQLIAEHLIGWVDGSSGAELALIDGNDAGSFGENQCSNAATWDPTISAAATANKTPHPAAGIAENEIEYVPR